MKAEDYTYRVIMKTRDGVCGSRIIDHKIDHFGISRYIVKSGLFVFQTEEGFLMYPRSDQSSILETVRAMVQWRTGVEQEVRLITYPPEVEYSESGTGAHQWQPAAKLVMLPILNHLVNI